MVIILVLLFIILGFLVSALKRFLDDKNLSEEDKEVVHSPISVGSITKSSGFIFIVVFLVSALGFKAVINGLFLSVFNKVMRQNNLSHSLTRFTQVNMKSTVNIATLV